MSAQIRIGGNVYGGGNHAEVRGSTRVTVKAGDIGAVVDTLLERPLADPQGRVFGGARMANVLGNSFVNIDGENATDYILINQVFGGNDIAGTVGTTDTIPSALTEVGTTERKNNVDNTFNSFVRISSKVWIQGGDTVHYTRDEITKASTDPEAAAYGKDTTDVKPDPNAKKIYIGQLFGGSNGDFTYTDENGNSLRDGDDYIIKQGNDIIARSATPFVHPELDKTYLEIKGGSIVYGYGGGNNATVKEQNIIHIDNPSAVVNHIKVDEDGVEDANGTDLLTTARFREMGINTTYSQPSSGEYQVGRFFGGNNKAEMSIRPTWNLLAGKIRNLYSGGNQGAMTSPEGLLLEIKDYSTLIVDNLYGGCRMADVKPTVNNEYVSCVNIEGYNFPDELSARTLVRGGHVNNVYGGNDVTGTVYGGNAVGIYTAVYGDVYGGGNGAYPYTDSKSMEGDDIYGDFYYSTDGYSDPIDALNAFRPNAEQVSVRLAGTDANHKTVIKGSVFVGGNCASLDTKKSDPLVELKMGSHVIADKVFLGNNGEKMVDSTLLKLYADNNSLVLTDSSVFAGYMNGVAMPLKPNIVFDNTSIGDPANYKDYTSMIGSFYGGGNRGSMIIGGKTSLKFDKGLIIFDKLVGGCNNADVEKTKYNAPYEGGLLGSADEQGNYTEAGKIKDRLELNLNNVVVEPRRWNDTFKKITSGTLTPGKEYYTTDLHRTKFTADGSEPAATEDNPYYELETVGLNLDWNTAIWSIAEDDFISTDSTTTGNDLNRRLIGGNVYGGCYTSGHVNGNVIININQDLVKRNVIFADSDPEDPYKISSTGARRSGVLKEAQGDDVLATEMSVFGGGCGEKTAIWGSTTINHGNGYVFQIFGGGEEGIVGNKNNTDEHGYNAAYSTTVNLKGINTGYSEEESGLPIPEAEYIYGGGCEGDVLGDSYVYLGNGRVYDAFGGASNADIYGGTEVHIGYNGGFPWIRDNIYGGNDFGGTIKGKRNHTMATIRPVFDSKLLQSSTYVKYIQGRVDSIYGGNYGNYDYANRVFKNYTNDDGSPKEDFNFPHLTENSFIHFVPEDNSSNSVKLIFGGSEGFPGHHKLNNSMQQDTYVLLDDTKTKNVDRFANVDVYGGGAFAGVGESLTNLGAGRTAVDLFAGSFHNVYGGCNQEGLVGYTRVNVPSESTAQVNALFGGGKGYNPALFKKESTKALAARYCDHYVTCVDYQSKNAIVNDAIYGGNENSRISCDTYINVEAPVMQSNGYQATIYGAGYGTETVSGRTNVFMNNGSNAYKVFGGGRDGNAMNYASLTRWLGNQYAVAGTPVAAITDSVLAYRGILENFNTYLTSHPIRLPEKTGTYANALGEYDGTYTNDILTSSDYHQTNVHLMNGGNVSGYAYGGGFGTDAIVSGTTYLELKGGNVDKDIYGGGQGGSVYDEYGLKTFTAATNVNIEGGMARNVYGGGYLGHVGWHEGEIFASNEGDIPAVTNVTIGKENGNSFYNGIPAIMRNAYGGGEGGSVYGTANLTINNGYIGYRYKNTATSGTAVYDYVPELDDQTANAIEMAGCAFGGGYVVNSYVDSTNVKMYGGTIRGSIYGGGEIGPIGRGTIRYKDTYTTYGVVNNDARIYKAGKTHVQLYDGHVKRNVYGGGRGHDSWGGDGTKYMLQTMTQEEFDKLDLKCKGDVFGQTEVDIYGGEVGTDEGVAQGYGNVFGGGDIGCVYSATGSKDGVRYDGDKEGYYYSGGKLTEDCKMLVEPWCKAKSTVTINGVSYAAGEYVPTDSLNYLGNKNASASDWAKLGKTDINKEGIIIHNAVFAGGNTASGSTEVYANTNTVFGNATASVHDVYNRDLISIGRGRVGGLYGDGNLTLVDGYRELNITNYGTDFYHITPEITLDQYNELPVREAAYYEIRYKCLESCTDKEGKTYAEGSTITADELVTVFDGVKVKVGTDSVLMIKPDGKPQESYWIENGVCSRYAGRPMNTIQRADFCGVFGSRMVMQGAQDRVPETVDYTNYTINRVREVSLNKKTSVRSDDSSDERNREHGNYFGIYSVVNYLGALTSDVDFQDSVRVTDNRDYQTESDAYDDVTAKAYGSATYYDWKAGFHDEHKRNNGNSHNKVALASGVYLELTSEKSKGKGLYEKDWGLITGVVELDLINVQTGMGGGYVYAKNEHGVRSDTDNNHTILTGLNKDAVTNKKFTYTTSDDSKKEWQTSGNFVHSTQTIIDDCYNIGDKYKTNYLPPDGVPAHYWYIKGSVYVYDQYISAYTGSPNAFSEVVSIPLTITSASHGKMTLLNVQPNRYAYYANGATKTKLKEGQKIIIRDKEYGLNDAINYWDYSQLSSTEKAMFEEKTYVVITDCKIGNDTIREGTVYLPSEYNELKTDSVYHIKQEKNVAFDYAFRQSNNVSHNTGYILTYNIDNPNRWNTWFTPKTGNSLTEKVDSAEIKTKTISDYEDGPTYTPIETGMFGQNDYKVGSIISKEEYTTYNTAYSNLTQTQKDALGAQATFKDAFIVTKELETTKQGVSQRLHKGAIVVKEDYTATEWSKMSGSLDSAFVVTSTIQLSKIEFIYRSTYMSKEEKGKLETKYPSLATDIAKSVVPAYYCISEGKYGGNYYESGNNYRALAAFSSMSPEDRSKFTFNYDALDLLIDPTYGRAEGVKYQYDGNYTSAEEVEDTLTGNKATYSLKTSIDYTATYKGDTKLTLKDSVYVKHGSSTIRTNELYENDELTNTVFESLPNEQYCWAPIEVKKDGDTLYVVKQTIVLGDTPYAGGQVITKETYKGLGDSDKNKVTSLTFTDAGYYYYCRESYEIDESIHTDALDTNKGAVSVPAGIKADGSTLSGSYSGDGTTIPHGTVIGKSNYDLLVNKQSNFSFHGLAPTETSTLYVTRGSDIFDLSKEKIITVIYQYDYVESDKAGMHITPVSERHILNIHLNFESGAPTVEDIRKPDIILPGTSLSMPEPYVTPGAYEITGGGWKLFDTPTDAERHINGVEYTNSEQPLYLYQNEYYLAYYTKTYLGETYSNHVPVSVANYHDLKKVMADTLHHYYIDHKDIFNRLKVEPKIYINDYSKDATGSKNGLDLFKNLYDLSLLTEKATTGDLKNHELLSDSVKAGKHLEFFLRTDINHPASWTPIGNDDEGQCFKGTLHGDGHTVSGLDHSLFNNLCGNVYNLGVTGSFNTAGVADKGTGYVESAWTNTTGTPDGTVRAIYGTPNADNNIKQIVNSYYQKGKSYKTDDDGKHGLATPMSAQEFYNGTVAYNLNNFYLHKRYANNKGTVNESVKEARYYTIGIDDKLTLQPYRDYVNKPELCSSGYIHKPEGKTENDTVRYVEERFADGDFRYAGGIIPDEEDERYYSKTVTDPVTGKETEDNGFFPIWPDDYIFFGQKLTYGWAVEQHDSLPSAIAKIEGRISYGSDANRVYRAPAYYRNDTLDVAHFNPHAYLAQTQKDVPATKAYPYMTAIDFHGHNDIAWSVGNADTGLPGGKKAFYAPLLDDDGLRSIVNCDETKNLLVYSPSADANAKTFNVLKDYFVDPEYNSYYDNSDKYRLVAEAPTGSVYGHRVQSNLKATNDHLLVDKQDFNAPIAYTFDGDHLMWYQRIPADEEYVDLTKGWQGISVPFSAELVTTNEKGEITHFYEGSTKGHEYWLRQLKNGDTMTEKETDVLEAKFQYPGVGDVNKDYTNKFLWNYYYMNEEVHNQKDKNDDTYLQYRKYYNSSHTYTGYPLLTKATPYIIGFPGETYYEFDLSGNFEAKNTKVTISKLDKQVITLASNKGISIGVSDKEMTGMTVTYESTSYNFKPNYMNKSLEAGTDNYVLNAAGSSFDKVPATGDATVVTAFRPYFTIPSSSSSSGAKAMRGAFAKKIVFGNADGGFGEGPETVLDGSLEIYTRENKIFTTSYMNEVIAIRIVNAAGAIITNYVLQPGETVETPVAVSGVYVVNKKKVFVE